MKKEEKTNKEIFQPVMIFFAKTTSWVAIPAILALLIKSYLEVSQIIFFVLVAIAFIITIYGIYREINIYKKSLNKEDNKNLENNGNK